MGLICKYENGKTVYVEETPEEIAERESHTMPSEKDMMYQSATYAQCVAYLIHQKYSADDETALLRHKINGEKETEYEAYSAYAEECKTTVKAKFTELGRTI